MHTDWCRFKQICPRPTWVGKNEDTACTEQSATGVYRQKNGTINQNDHILADGATQAASETPGDDRGGPARTRHDLTSWSMPQSHLVKYGEGIGAQAPGSFEIPRSIHYFECASVPA